MNLYFMHLPSTNGILLPKSKQSKLGTNLNKKSININSKAFLEYVMA